MTVNLLKRLESSVEAFRLTLAQDRGRRRQDARADSTTTPARSPTSTSTSPTSTLDDDDDDDANVEALSFGEKIQIDLADIDVESWQRDLWNDRETLRELLDGDAARSPPTTTSSSRRSSGSIEDKVANPINPGNRKVLIFSAFADTADYLYRELAPALSEAGLRDRARHRRRPRRQDDARQGLRLPAGPDAVLAPVEAAPPHHAEGDRARSTC